MEHHGFEVCFLTLSAKGISSFSSVVPVLLTFESSKLKYSERNDNLVSYEANVLDWYFKKKGIVSPEQRIRITPNTMYLYLPFHYFSIPSTPFLPALWEISFLDICSFSSLGVYFKGDSGFGEQSFGFFFRNAMCKYLMPFFVTSSEVE